MSKRRSKTCKIVDNPTASYEDLWWLYSRNKRAALQHPNFDLRWISTREDAVLASQGPHYSMLFFALNGEEKISFIKILNRYQGPGAMHQR